MPIIIKSTQKSVYSKTMCQKRISTNCSLPDKKNFEMMILIQAKSYRKCKTNRLESRSKAQTIPDQDQLSLRTRLARATQWVNFSTVKGNEFSEMKIIHKALIIISQCNTLLI